MKYPLAKNGVFGTIQGEGATLGMAMVFIRLAGCSIGCPLCDTDYKMNQKVSTANILSSIEHEAKIWNTRWVWITGGEPTDHDLTELIETLHDVGFQIALATAGHKEVNYKVDFTSVSPHYPSKWVRKWGTEVKLVPGLNGFHLKDFDLSGILFANRYVQPCEGKPETVTECIGWIQEHPDWKLTCQAHKQWGLA